MPKDLSQHHTRQNGQSARPEAFLTSLTLGIAAVSVGVLLSGCGGGSASDASAALGGGLAAAPPSNLPASPGSVSSGAITAFGSVFVNGHEYNTDKASVTDADTNTTTSAKTGLEVGMVLDVTAASNSSSGTPVASELRVHPLARGYVDASSASAGTLTVLGQTVQLSSGTLFADHRACASATNGACAAITGQSGLSTTAGSGATAVAGSYVTVHGYPFATGVGASSANSIVATLVSVSDAPGATGGPAAFKAEGPVVSVGTGSIVIGDLGVDLSAANCFAKGGRSATTPCAAAFATGQVVSVFAKNAPSLPASSFKADTASLNGVLADETEGATVEVEGKVSTVTASPASFVLRGATVDATGLATGTALPAVGDVVQVVGTVGSNGQTLKATKLSITHAASNGSLALEGNLGVVKPGPAAGITQITVSGLNLTVDARTRLADFSLKTWDLKDLAANPFNPATFQSYVKASVSQHVIVQASIETGGSLHADRLVLAPASNRAGVSGKVDASPAPVNSGAKGMSTTFSVGGLAVVADPSAIAGRPSQAPGKAASVPANLSSPSIAVADRIIAVGTFSGGKLTVAATPGKDNFVIDFGTGSGFEADDF
jgi:hypothetical protein